MCCTARGMPVGARFIRLCLCHCLIALHAGHARRLLCNERGVYSFCGACMRACVCVWACLLRSWRVRERRATEQAPAQVVTSASRQATSNLSLTALRMCTHSCKDYARTVPMHAQIVRMRLPHMYRSIACSSHARADHWPCSQFRACCCHVHRICPAVFARTVGARYVHTLLIHRFLLSWHPVLWQR